MIRIEIDQNKTPFGVIAGKKMTLIKATSDASHPSRGQGNGNGNGNNGNGPAANFTRDHRDVAACREEVMSKLEGVEDHDWFPIAQTADGGVNFAVAIDDLAWWVNLLGEE